MNHFKTENFVREQIAFLQKEVDHCELNLWPASKATGIEDGEQSEISAADFIIVLEAQREAMQKLANEAFEIERRVNSLEEKE